MTTREGLLWELRFTFDQPDWYAGVAAELGQLVEDSPLWSHFTAVESRGGRSTVLTSASFQRALHDVASHGWELSVGPGSQNDLDDRGNLVLECRAHDDWLILQLTLVGDAFHTFASRLEELTWPFLNAFGRPLLLPISGVALWFQPDLTWERMRPRPSAPFLAFGNVVDVLDSRLPSAWVDHESGPVMERILAAPVPEGVRKVERDGKVMIFWADDLTDPVALATARMRHERWLAELVVPGASDRRLEIRAKAEAPPLSFVDRDSRLGFKTVVVFPDGSVEQPAWDAALAVARTGQLAGVYLIVPLREQALALRERAVAAGFAGVAYPGAGGISVAGESA